ncbi:MAG: SGNH/GDSL hydrolase family protein [Clostridia bacterium]|nr:SGNH/GDSL hydrolase family protein [Clostridia bacterium]
MKTKLWALLMALVLCLSVLPASVAADGTAIDTDGFLFALTDGGAIVTDPAAVPDGATVYKLNLYSRAAELRCVWPSGVRFVTSVSKSQMDDLLACDAVASVEIGTRILPADLLDDDGLMQSTLAVDVPATVGMWYKTYSTSYQFAGSLTDIKEANYTRELVGVGYARVTLTSGEVITVCADAPASGSFALLAEDHLYEGGRIGEAERTYFEGIAALAWAGDSENLQELNVLAIGDSLFDGDYLAGKEQWIGLLATECKWNFTNLGHDGWTVAYNPGVYAEGQNVRNSMYDYLFNHGDIYRFGGSNASHYRGKLYDKTPADVDLILLEGGVNDYGWGIPLGTVNDTDGSTLLGAWRLIIDKLLVDYPNAKIVFVTSWYVEGHKTVNGEERSRMDYVCHGVKELFETYYADEARFTVVDAGDPAVSGIDMASIDFRDSYSKSTTDSNHLNERGMKMMAHFMREVLNGLFAE